MGPGGVGKEERQPMKREDKNKQTGKEVGEGQREVEKEMDKLNQR